MGLENGNGRIDSQAPRTGTDPTEQRPGKSPASVLNRDFAPGMSESAVEFSPGLF